MQAYSCDDDGYAYSGGHWIAVESKPGSNSYKPKDCTSGEGGGGARSPTSFTNSGQNVGCCDNRLDTESAMTWASAPLLQKVCGSINTGGGVGVGYKIDGSADTLLCGI